MLGMIVFHAGWDLAHLGLLGGAGIPAWWQGFGNVVASLFLALSGVGLVLARRRGQSAGRALRRFGLVSACAVAITLASWLAAPQSAIWFGILHCIVVANLLALPLLGAPPLALGILAAAVVAAPSLASGHVPAAPFWTWLGLSDRLPDTLDYRPVFPWAGAVFIGVLLARMVPEARVAGPVPGGRVGLALGWSGRHSLAIYVTHQAVLFPLLWLIAQGVGVQRPSWSDAFERQCRVDCLRTAGAAPLCERLCACAKRAAARQMSDAARSLMPIMTDRDRLAQIAARCASRTAGPDGQDYEETVPSRP